MKHAQRFFSLSLFLLAFLAVAAAPSHAQTILRVDADASAPGTGTSWSTAYPALQDAFDEVNNNPGTDYEIWVAEGTYYPDADNVDNDGDGSPEHTADDASESFTLTRDGVAVYGGFSGGETDRSARDPDANVVILSGDLQQDDVVFAPNTDSDSDNSTYTQTDHLRGTNANNVLFFDGDRSSNIKSETVLDGVTVTAGQATSFPNGAGLVCDGTGSGNVCSPTIADVTFRGNQTKDEFRDGGGIALRGGNDGEASPTLENVTFRANTATDDGGALSTFTFDNGTVSPVCTDCRFVNNAAQSGGAIYNYASSGGTANPLFTGCTFENNAARNGGAIYNNGFEGTANFTIRNSTLRQNEADHTGGALHNFAGRSTGEANPTIDNVTFENNRGVLDPPADSELGGGAIWNNAFEGGTASPQISNSTFIGNRAEPQPTAPTDTADGGAIYSTSDSTTTGGTKSTIAFDIDNTTFENNFATRAGGAYFSIAFQGGDVQSTITDSEFIGNTAGGSGALFMDGFRGSGTANVPPPTTNSMSVTNTTFTENQAVDTEVDVTDNVIGRKSEGGAIGVLAERGGRVDATLKNIDITGGTGLDANFGGAIHIASDTTQNASLSSLATSTYENVTIRGVSAEQGGAISVIGDEEEARPRFENVVISGAEATRGGAIDVMGQAGNGNAGVAEPVFVNTTITGNNAFRGGAVYDSTSGSGTVATPSFTNTILWGNSATDSGSEVYNTNNGTSTINYSIVEGGDAGIASGNGFSNGTGNLNANPQFPDADGEDGTIGTADDDLRLEGPGSPNGASPAIDAGDNTAVATSTDLAGNDRRFDVGGVTNTGNTPNGNPPVDIGAYESTGAELPVELVSFEAQTTEETVALTWRTASEQNNAGFTVQRQAEDGTWTKIGFVDSRAEGGTTSQPQSYRFADKNVSYAADSLTYRLRQVDIDGSTTLSDAVTVARGVQSVELLGTAPNPARSQATIRYALPERTDVTIRLYDVLGRRVRTVTNREAEGRHRTTVDVSGLSSGVYVLRLTAGGTTKTQKMTVVQ